MNPALVDRAMFLYRLGTGEAAVPHAFIVWFDTIGWHYDGESKERLENIAKKAVQCWLIWERTFA